MTLVSRRVLVPFAVAIALGSILSACSTSTASGAVGTAGQVNSFITVDVSSPPIITIQNRTAQPLIDINIAIKSGMLTFADRVSRLEANERRPIRQGDFTSRDGTSFNLRVARPKEINVTAKDLSGKQFEATMPWE